MVLRPTMPPVRRRSTEGPSSIPLQLESTQPRASEMSSMPSPSASVSAQLPGAHIALVPQVVRGMLLQVSELPHESAVQLFGSLSTHELVQLPHCVTVLIDTLQPLACSVPLQLAKPATQVEVQIPPPQVR